MFAALEEDDRFNDHPLKVQLARLIGAQQHADDIQRIFAVLRDEKNALAKFQLATGLAEGMSGHESGHSDALKPAFESAVQVAVDVNAKREERLAAVRLLRYAPPDTALSPLLNLLKKDTPQSLQLAALDSVDPIQGSPLAEGIVRAWSDLSPRVRIAAADILVKRPQRAIELLQAIKEAKAAQNDLTAAQVARLLNNPDAQVKSLAQQTLVAPAAQREAAIEALKPALSLKGDLERGHKLFAQRCISCHKAGNEGNNVGPDLVTVRNGGPEKLMLSILDPNREVAANFIAYTIDTTDGENILGIVTSDTPASITLREAYGKETSIPRDKIKKIASQRKSLMPEGLEAGLKPQDFADLLEFVQHFPTGK
jgi:putative heme-binding domain-containing protein